MLFFPQPNKNLITQKNEDPKKLNEYSTTSAQFKGQRSNLSAQEQGAKRKHEKFRKQVDEQGEVPAPLETARKIIESFEIV